MRVLLAATGSQMFSGATRCLLDLATALKNEVEVLVLLPEHGDLEQALQERDISYVVIKEMGCWWVYINQHQTLKIRLKFQLKKLLNIASIFRIKRLMKKEHIDLVHVNAVTSYTAGQAAEEMGLPVVWHIREMMEEDLGITFYNMDFSRKVLNQATQMLAISGCVKKKWEKAITVPIEIVYDGVLVEEYYVEEKKKHNGVNVLIYGRIAHGKGQLFFIQGVIEALNMIKVPCGFSIAGMIEDQVYYEECLRTLRKSGCQDKIRYIGEISDIKSLLAETDIVCVCSVCEGFGRVTVESMLGRCLVIGANSGATGEIISDGQTGILYEANNLVDFSQKLSKAVNEMCSYEKVVTAGQAYAKSNYTVGKNASGVMQVYHRYLYK